MATIAESGPEIETAFGIRDQKFVRHLLAHRGDKIHPAAMHWNDRIGSAALQFRHGSCSGSAATESAAADTPAD